MEDIFIFTEAYNCGKIARVALESFLKFHPELKVTVFGLEQDFNEINIDSKHVIYYPLDNDETLKNLYMNGHQGTAYIFASVLSGRYGSYQKIIHFDADVIFREECLSDIKEGFDNGYHLIGQRRNYEKNRSKLTSVGGKSLIGVTDTIGTCFFGIDSSKITVEDFSLLHRMCVGGVSLTGEPILDFFDPVSFHVMHNDGKVKYLSSINYGGGDENGNWDNGFNGLNLLCDFGKKFVHFAGVGSGLNFHKNGSGNVPVTYSSWAKERYNLYSMLFCGENIGPYDENAYKKMKKELEL